ncbi:MAG TPA: hypothetical protein VFO11_08570, partial [Candidatus Polarisedimenticolaceae bacterium]|nr:hypothetical protein [Candidatus Polarisedimenticolaceae bacterium]
MRTYPLAERTHKVTVDQFGAPVDGTGSLASFLDGLPRLLGAQSLRDLADAIVSAREKDRPVVLAMGAHVIKVGLGPVVAQLMEEGTVTAVALNGAGAIHDWEVAAVGA